MQHLQSDSLFMQIAIEHAWKFQTLTLPNPAVGALIVYNNAIIALQAHYKAGCPHAEVLACKEAFLYLAQHDVKSQEKILNNLKTLSHSHSIHNTHNQTTSNSCRTHIQTPKNSKNTKEYSSCHKILHSLLKDLEIMQESCEIHHFIEKYHSNIFHECIFFVTLEPCNHYGKTPPCAKLLQTIRPQRIVIAHRDTTPNASGGITRLSQIPITQNILQSQAHTLLFPFMQWQEHQKFTLFKIANRLNGDYKNGSISNEESRIFTHNMRCIADNIVISGETLRNDNPLLDTRFALAPYNLESSLPKIFILSKTMNIKDLCKYRIYNREVEIIHSTKDLPNKGFTIIEGGFNLLQSLLQDDSTMQLDCIMGYIAPSLMPTQNNAIDTTHTHHQIPHDFIHSNILHDFTLCYSTCLNDSWKQHANANITLEKQPNIIYWLFKELGY